MSSGINLSFFSPLKPCNTKNGQSKVTLDYISQLINLNFVLISLLNLVSKPSKWALFQFYYNVHLKILPTLLEGYSCISSNPVMKMDMIKSMNSLNAVLSLFQQKQSYC